MYVHDFESRGLLVRRMFSFAVSVSLQTGAHSPGAAEHKQLFASDLEKPSSLAYDKCLVVRPGVFLLCLL